jgi:chromosome segregation ATPase
MNSTPAPSPSQQLNQKRHAALELEYAVDGLDVQLQVLADELRSVEGHGVTGLLGALTGGKQRQVEKIHTLQSELAARRDEMARTLASLTEEISSLTAQVDELKIKETHPQAESQSGENAERAIAQVPALKSAQEFLKRIEAAADACEEARKDLLSEMQTAGTLGRHRITHANRALKMIASRVRKSTGEDCAQRVRQSLSRLQRRLQAACELQPHDGEMAMIEHQVARLANTFSGSGLASKSSDEDSGSWLHDILQSMGMTLDLRLATARRAVSDAERGGPQSVDTPPPLPASLCSDAIQVSVPPKE